MNNENNDKITSKPYVIATIVLSAIWLVAAWFIVHAWISWETGKEFAISKKRAQTSIDQISEGLERSLNLLQAVPAILSRDDNLQRSIHQINHNKSLLNLTPKERFHLLEPQFEKINNELYSAVNEVGTINSFWVTQEDGLIIASSSFEEETGVIGTSISDREYFKTAKSGRFGYQYILSKAEEVQGIVFSIPIKYQDQFVGTLSAMIELSFLSNWINTSNGFIVDRYGVILQASNPDYVFLTMPDAALDKLTTEEKEIRYNQTEFKPLSFVAYDANEHLYKIDSNKNPFYVLSVEMEGYRLKLITAVECPEFTEFENRQVTLYIIVAIGGVLLILLISAFIYYFRALHQAQQERSKRALIDQLTSYDSLTGLYSRSLTNQLITQSILYATKSNTQFAILFLNIDLFKDINDNFGHDVGDHILREIAKRLTDAVEENHVVIRYGGDDFIILAQTAKDTEEFADLARKLQSAIQKPFVLESTSLTLTASIGIALYPNDGDTASMLLRNADIALNNVKTKGRSDYMFYKPEMSIGLVARKSLEAEMKTALENNEFFLCYQPQYSPVDDKITGCEALVRWRHPTRGIVPPSEFIPAAEYSGFIYQLGEWILGEACRQSKEWRDTLKENIPVAVNLSGIQFQRTDLVNIVANIVKKYDMDPGLLELEMTESILMSDTKRTFDIIGGLKNLGITISIDDFGTGYSSLAYLKKFDADVLKIDRTFVMNMENDSNSRAIILAIISMAKSLDYNVIAEGIETKEQCDLLAEMGCHSIQGYWFSKPIPANEFADFYMKHKNSREQKE